MEEESPMSKEFRLESSFSPSGDQPGAIRALVEGLEAGEAAMTLLGVTGSGKTYSIANVVQAVQRPTLVLAPNLTVVPVYTSKIYLCPKHKETLENLLRGHLKEDLCDTD